MSGPSARNDQPRSPQRRSGISDNENTKATEAKIEKVEKGRNKSSSIQYQPKDRPSSAHSSKPTTVELEAQIERFKKILERKEYEWQNTYTSLRRELTLAQDLFKKCQDDLWRLQPFPQVTDAEVLNDFDELCHRVSSWIDGEIAATENGENHKEQKLFSHLGDQVLASYMHEHPNFGEYYVRQMIHQFLCARVFSHWNYLVGLPSAAVDMLAAAEQAMPKLTPPRDDISIAAWRSETLTALSNAAGFDRMKSQEIGNLTGNLLRELLPIFPILSHETRASSHRLEHSIMTQAVDLANKMQVSQTHYQVELRTGEIGFWEPLTKDILHHFSFFDVKTRKPIKVTSRAVGNREGRLGPIIMSIEPSFSRVSKDGTLKELRTHTFLAALD